MVAVTRYDHESGIHRQLTIPGADTGQGALAAEHCQSKQVSYCDFINCINQDFFLFALILIFLVDFGVVPMFLFIYFFGGGGGVSNFFFFIIFFLFINNK